jgi:hypothetical protein
MWCSSSVTSTAFLSPLGRVLQIDGVKLPLPIDWPAADSGRGLARERQRGTVTIVKFAVFQLVGLDQTQGGVGHQQIIGQFLEWAAAVGPTQLQDPSGRLSGAITIRLVQ